MGALNEVEARQAFENGLREVAIQTGNFNDASLAFPNLKQDNPGTDLRMEVEHVDAEPGMLGLDGTLYSENGVYEVIVVGPKAKGQMAVRQACKDLKLLLPIGKHFHVPTGGNIAVRATPQIQPGYADDTSWRMPIIIQYVAAG